MRIQLKRIESALARLDKSAQTRRVQPSPSSNQSANQPSQQPSNQSPQNPPPKLRSLAPPQGKREKSSSFAFTLNPSKNPSKKRPERPARPQTSTPVSPATPPPPPPSNPSPPQPYQNKLSTLHSLKSAQISTHRHTVNPALATHLLKEIEEITVGWQQELKRILIAIQDLYLEGPIVDGWLESQTPDAAKQLPQAWEDTITESMKYDGSRPGYRLCGLDEYGRLWSKACPPDQVASVSVAIARYQKLRQLLKRKQQLENNLSRLAETLVLVHGSMKQ